MLWLKHIGITIRLGLLLVIVLVIILTPLIWAIASLYLVSISWSLKGVIFIALLASTYLLIPALSRLLVEGTRTPQ